MLNLVPVEDTGVLGESQITSENVPRGRYATRVLFGDKFFQLFRIEDPLISISPRCVERHFLLFQVQQFGIFGCRESHELQHFVVRVHGFELVQKLVRVHDFDGDAKFTGERLKFAFIACEKFLKIFKLVEIYF